VVGVVADEPSGGVSPVVEPGGVVELGLEPIDPELPAPIEPEFPVEPGDVWSVGALGAGPVGVVLWPLPIVDGVELCDPEPD
jgi:hypothetical protein